MKDVIVGIAFFGWLILAGILIVRSPNWRDGE